MKISHRIISCLILLIISLPLTLSPSQAEEEVSIGIDAPEQIMAGEAWSMIVKVKGLSAGESLNVTMLHGVTIHTSELQLGTGGIALWEFEAGILTQAGTSQINITVNEQSFNYTLEILANEPSQLQAFTSTNSLTAYGDSSTTLLSFVSDSYGNPVNDAVLTLRKTSPSGESSIGFMSSSHGLAHQTIHSLGNPGILRLGLNYGTTVTSNLTIVQLASTADRINLRLSSNCVLADGLDNITLTASVWDREGAPINDGQVVIFRWGTGTATRIIVDGNTSLHIPVPTTVGTYIYSANTGNISTEQSLEVTEGQCDD